MLENLSAPAILQARKPGGSKFSFLSNSTQKNLTHALKNMIFIQFWKFKGSRFTSSYTCIYDPHQKKKKKKKKKKNKTVLHFFKHWLTLVQIITGCFFRHHAITWTNVTTQTHRDKFMGFFN